MRCSVHSCTNDTKRTTKSDGVTFHLFPKEPALRKVWVEALGMSEWEPKDRSTVCSQHFVEDDFYRTKCGLRKIKNGAVPLSAQERASDSESDSNQGATLRVCRVCLCTNSKMYHIEDYNLKEAYQQLTGTPVQDGSDALPLALCAECAYRVALSARLRRQALRALQALSAVLRSGRRLSLADVRSVDRVQLRLQSSLASKSFAPDHFDLTLNEDDALKTEPTDDVDEVMMDNGMDDEEETKASPLAPIAQVEVKPERHEAFLEECDRSSDSDDDRALSEVVSEAREARTKRAKRGAKERRGKRRHEADESPSVTADKYMKSDVKRRKTQEGPDETLFTVSRLSYEQQIEEVERRRDSAAYKNAAFKCAVCYRGFHVKERCDAHLVRHSDASGAYACFICKTRLRSARALRKHLTAQHTELYSCKGCSFTTRNRGVAREHERWHAGARYHCPHCAASFDKLTTYMGHVRIKHASDFVCELCGFTFVSRKGIDVHKKKKHRLLADATLAGPDCGLCGVRFLSHEAYARHLQLSSRHSAERAPGDSQRIRNDSQSASAGGAARRPRRERRAAADAAADSPVGCEQCGVTLKDLRVYAQHFRRAHPDKNRTKYPAMKTPAMCELCGRIFQSMALLKDHMWVHTGEKRFKCERCDKSFTQKTNLVFHMRVHSAQRPSYECPLCGKHFAFYNNRRRHMFIHTGLKPHKCDTCGKSFTTAGEQKAHVEHVHLKKPWPKRARPRPTAPDQSQQSQQPQQPQQPQPSQHQMPWHKCAPED